MLPHRFRDLIASTTPAVATAMPAGCAAFLPCPGPVLSLFSPAQTALVAEVYRIARERADAQLREARRRRIPAFSVN